MIAGRRFSIVKVRCAAASPSTKIRFTQEMPLGGRSKGGKITVTPPRSSSVCNGPLPARLYTPTRHPKRTNAGVIAAICLSVPPTSKSLQTNNMSVVLFGLLTPLYLSSCIQGRVYFLDNFFDSNNVRLNRAGERGMVRRSGGDATKTGNLALTAMHDLCKRRPLVLNDMPATFGLRLR